MNLFDVLPQSYFSIFTSKNRSVYAESLSILYDILESDETVINKNDFVKALKEKGKSELDNLDILAEDSEFEVDKDTIVDTLASKASFIVRRLEETGWINISIDPETFEETVILPAYTIFMLKAFKDVISDEESPYLSLVHSTYSELKLEDEMPDELMYVTLVRCYENTKRLKVELVTLSHSIRMFQTKLTKVFQTNDVLHDFFDIYKSKINDRYYHPLKTFDSVAKFKRPIIQILEKWLNDKEIRSKLVMLASLTAPSNKREDIEYDVITKINYITDTYSTINSTISSIDKENSDYTKSTTNKILYLNNTDKTIKGHLENIFKHYAKNINDPRTLSKILSKMQDSIYLYEQGYIDAESFTFPILRKARDYGEPLPLIEVDMANTEIMREFLESTRNVYTDERVFSFMENAFGSADEISISEIPLPNFDAFICLIFATVKSSDKHCFYDMELVNQEKVINNRFVVPNFVFRRKKKEDN